jgi:hypothetical protein
MNTVKTIIAEWKELPDYDKDFFRHILIFFIPIASIFVWLVSTNTPPVLDAKVPNTQTEMKPNYELKGSWAKYAEGCYNRKYND